MKINKKGILEAVLKELHSNLARQHAANEEAADGATDSESRAESKWDTGGLEASYLARGYARQYGQTAHQYDQLQSFVIHDFTNRPVGMGALVECEIDGYTSWFFLLPHCGGMEIISDGMEVTIITPASPVAMQLMNKGAGAGYALADGRKGTIRNVV